MLSEFPSGRISACYEGLGHFQLDGANLQMQTHLVSKIMHKNGCIFMAVVLGPNWVYSIGPWRRKRKEKG